MDVAEFKIQEAIGTLPKEFRLRFCRGKPQISKGRRQCTLCEDTIKKGMECFIIQLGKNGYGGPINLNICMDCSWISIKKVHKILERK